MLGRSMFEAIPALLFPDRCAGCGRLSALLCQVCRATLTPYHDDNRPWPTSLTDMRIAFVFQGPLREAVHQMKYHGLRRMATPLGSLMAAHITDCRSKADAVMAIPLHAERLAERGFNQAEALARQVARDLHLPFTNEGLIRIRATDQQAKLNARARRENLRDAFRWQGGAPPRRVLLVDDIYTTGATMGACAEVLRAAGTEAVIGLALARSQLDRS